MPKTDVRMSAVKTHRKAEEARVKNKSRRNALATGEKKFRAAAATEDKAAAQKLFQEQCSALDKAVKVGTIHKNKASRKKSRLAAVLNAAE
ncbi:MAG: 30S ribosomal protein S20 [Lentisphaeria bacterium]|nr:30S ribosomal protein S20 [Lentisphaerota bacterium]MBO5201181.1 30S ribosomal protein S20 [Lentisphaeria bacterium]MBO5682305.1 30S ribosomal protein S20 [Lentisphaeria bacterium]MBO5694370.1 30S ribosomal protein S20 [Lentisphaeria bacterium]MBO5802892.1 30S ribosomal protein S20 [Lentisphaeria bacterium]